MQLLLANGGKRFGRFRVLENDLAAMLLYNLALLDSSPSVPRRKPLKNYVWIAAVLGFASLWGCGKSARQYLDRGNELFAAGKYTDATLNYRNAIKKDPQMGEAQYRLGLALLREKKANEAYQALTAAVALDSRNNDAKVQLANLCLAAYVRDTRHPAALYKQAERLANDLSGPGGNRSEGQRLKGTLALIDNHPEAAVDAFREAVRLAPRNPEASLQLAQALLRDNQPEEGERMARQTIQSFPEYSPGYEVLYALYRTQQNWTKAEELLKLWAAKKPKESTPILQLAAFYYSQKHPDEGEKVLQTLLDRQTDFPQADLMVGDFHAMARNLDKALADYQRGASRDHPRKQIYDERVAGMLAAQGHNEEALKAADAIIAHDPSNVFARTLKVQLLDRMGGPQNLNAASIVAADLAKQAPGDAQVQTLAGQTFFMNGKLDQAYSYYQQAAKADPRSASPRLLLARLETSRKNYPAVLQQANAVLEIKPNDPTGRLFHVIGLAGTHDYARAKTEAEQLARDTKGAPQVQMQLGIIALGQGDYTKAEDYFRKLYKEGTFDTQPLAGLVNAYEGEHQPDRALQLMESEVQKSPDSLYKGTLLAVTEEAAGKTNQALAELEKQAAQHPTSADPFLRIAELQMKHGNLESALQALQRAQQLAPERPGWDGAIGTLQDQLGRKTEAIANYRKALAKTPDNPMVMNNLAFALAETGGSLSEAQDLVTAAIRKAPSVPQLQDTLAWVELKQHNPSAALPILERLTRSHPEEVNFLYHYVVALNDSGNSAAARKQAELALTKKPSPEIATALRNLLAQAK
jgi:tetratricopeptide (TPR) repeat protein